jgi:hypothetical protein
LLTCIHTCTHTYTFNHSTESNLETCSLGDSPDQFHSLHTAYCIIRNCTQCNLQNDWDWQNGFQQLHGRAHPKLLCKSYYMHAYTLTYIQQDKTNSWHSKVWLILMICTHVYIHINTYISTKQTRPTRKVWLIFMTNSLKWDLPLAGVTCQVRVYAYVHIYAHVCIGVHARQAMGEHVCNLSWAQPS